MALEELSYQNQLSKYTDRGCIISDHLLLKKE